MEFPCGCRGKTLGHLSDEKITCPPSQRGSVPSPDLVICSDEYNRLALGRCSSVKCLKVKHSPEAVILNHKQTCSVHFRRTVKFIAPFSSFLIPHTWQHLGFDAGLLWVHVCLCLCAQKTCVFPIEIFRFGSPPPSYYCLFCCLLLYQYIHPSIHPLLEFL